jgi:Kef-type K+ transport system membrane component KefB
MGKLSDSELLLLLLQLSAMLALGRLMAELARKLRQPAVVGEIIAGLILGPTVFGTISPEVFASLFPHTGASTLALDAFTKIAVVLLLFIAGLEVDLHIVFQQGKQAVSASLLGLVIPFILGFIIPYLIPSLFQDISHGDVFLFSLFMGTAMAISALPVIVRILLDLKLFKTKIGMLVVASAMVDDIIGWMIFSVLLALIRNGEPASVGYTFLMTVGFTVFMLTLGRWMLNKVLPWVNRNLAWPGGLLSLSLAICFLGSAFTEYIGIHTVFGAFMIGVALGDSKHLSEKAKEIVHQFINNIFAPLFFVGIGLKVNFLSHFDPALTAVILVIAFAGKLIGSGLGAYLGGFSKRDALAVGFGMNARGAMEIILGLIALEAGLINQTLFVSLVIMALVTSMTSGPMMKWILERNDSRQHP